MYNLLSVGGNYALAQSVSRKLQMPLQQLDKNIFYDQELELTDRCEHQLQDNNKPWVLLFGIDRNCINVNLLELLTVMSYLQKNQACILALACFYLPYCRQNNQLTQNQPSILGYLLQELSRYVSTNFLFLDTHTEDIKYYFPGRVKFLPMHKLWYRYICTRYDTNTKFLIIAPDAGARIRTMRLSCLLDADCLCLQKSRQGGEINFSHINRLHNTEEYSIIIVDDILDKGMTLMAVIDALRNEGIRSPVLSCVTHGVLSKPVSNLNTLIENNRLVLSNSIGPTWCSCVDVTDLFVAAIKELVNDRKISDPGPR